jgi:hypothetical protein
MTLSARTNTFGGMIRPICLADLKFTTNSLFSGWSTEGRPGLLAQCTLWKAITISDVCGSELS